jgi:hypothetical protein
MKKLLLVILSLFTFGAFAQTINVSTGLDASATAPNGIGTNDGNWKYGVAINGTSIAKVVNYYSGYWQPTPVTATNAQFIGVTGNFMAQTPGLYYFERSFTVAPGIGLLSTDFSIAIDDDLKSVELIDPSGSATDLTSKFIRSTTPTAYYLSKAIRTELKCPVAGIWKVRVYVNFIDTAAGFLLSGNVTMSGNCCKISDEKCNPEFKVKLSPNPNGTVNIDLNPVITSGADHYWGVVYATSTADVTPIPLSTIMGGSTFGASNIGGVCKPLGMGTGITCSSSNFGYNYSGFPIGKCFKITHYIKCCNKWYSKTRTICTKAFCTEEKEGEIMEASEVKPSRDK